MIGALIYHLGAYFARVLPRRISWAIGSALGRASYYLRARARRTVIQNLRVIHEGSLSEAELRRCAKRVFMNFTRSIYLFLRMPYIEHDQLLAAADFSSFQAAAEEIGEGKPFIVATAHVGPWELGGIIVTYMGYRLHTVALEHPSTHVTRFFSQRRELLGMQAHPLGSSFPILKHALEHGDCVALLIDRAYGRVSKRFALFGVESEFPLGHLVLSAACQVPVLTGAVVFDGPDNFRFVHRGTHYPEDIDDEFEKLERLQEKCLRDLEGIIREYSDQWFNFFPLMRTERHDY